MFAYTFIAIVPPQINANTKEVIEPAENSAPVTVLAENKSIAVPQAAARLSEFFIAHGPRAVLHIVSTSQPVAIS